MRKERSCGERTKMDLIDVKVVAIIGIVILKSIALWKGRNGKLFALSAAIVGGLAGYQIGITI